MLGSRRPSAIVATLALLATFLLISSASAPAAPADARVTSVWTASSYENVFKDTLPPPGASKDINLIAARNEYEAAQVMLRKDQRFTIDKVALTNLTSGANTIAATNLTYQFVEFEHLKANSTFGQRDPVKDLIRKAPGDFPDALSNETSVEVPARTTQPIWIRAYVPKDTKPGLYKGTATVQTDQGNSTVPIQLDVQNVTIPDAKDSTFTTNFWQILYGALSWDEGAGDTMEIFYDHKRLSPEWWELITNIAKNNKQHRLNTVPLNVVQLLIGGGTTMDADGKYAFDWSLFDKLTQTFVDQGAIKRLEGFWMHGKAYYRDYWQIEIVDKDANGKYVRGWERVESAKAKNFVDQFVPALKAHLESKGWADKWWMHVGDEPNGAADVASYKKVASMIREHWADVRLSDATFNQGSVEELEPIQSFLIPNEWNLDDHQQYYKDKIAAGKEVWLYNCNIPTKMYLNRFIDQPVYHQRLTMWYAYSLGVTGYLHWALNNWQYPMDQQEVRGDGWITKPDKKNNTIKSTIRLESLRDGLEERELLEQVGKQHPDLAKGIVANLVQRANRYSGDTASMERTRAELVRAAAGKPVFAADLARTKPATASTEADRFEAKNAVDGNVRTSWRSARADSGAQWVQVDLGKQTQVDGLRLAWGPTYAKGYQVQLSYDGATWTDAFSTTTGNGGEDFVGLNAKARYVRLKATASSAPTAGYTLSDLEVGGFALDRENLAAGRPYTKSADPAADHGDSSGRESTDGILAGHFSDARGYGYHLKPGDDKTVDVTVDLGAAKQVSNVKIHRYEDYEQTYSPDKVRVFTSKDGTTFVPKGTFAAANGPNGLWYDVTFPDTSARYVKVSYEKKFTEGADALFLDEIEAYGPSTAGLVNFAEGRQYTKSEEPDDPYFADADNRESTDGVIAGPFTDEYGYAFYAGNNETRNVSLTLDLKGLKALDLVQLKAYDDGFHQYSPDTVRVYTKADGGDFEFQGEAAWPIGSWFDIPLTDVKARYVRLDLSKADGKFADYMFLDEVAIFGDPAQSTTDLAAGRAYTATTKWLDPSYADSGGESTDGVLAGHYSDGKSWAYVAQPDETMDPEITFDLGQARTLSLVNFREYFDGEHKYAPDKVVVFTSTDGSTWTEKGSVTKAADRWFSVGFTESSARYVKVRAIKTYGYFAEYIFVDEIEIYGR